MQAGHPHFYLRHKQVGKARSILMESSRIHSGNQIFFDKGESEVILDITHHKENKPRHEGIKYRCMRFQTCEALWMQTEKRQEVAVAKAAGNAVSLRFLIHKFRNTINTQEENTRIRKIRLFIESCSIPVRWIMCMDNTAVSCVSFYQ